MRKSFALTLLAIPSAILAQPSGPNWDRVDAGTKAVCKRVGIPKPPAADRPSATQKAALKGCNSEALYYGEGMKPDYAKARQCAFTELDAGKDDGPLSGGAILMQLYANGLGVKRDPDLATAYACQIDGAPMENSGRVAHLQALKAKPGHFDYCDDITSGFAQGVCEHRASKQAVGGRDAKLAALVARMPPAAKALYPAAKKAFDAFVDVHGDGEVDLSGTARAAMVIAEQDSVRDQFLLDLNRLAARQWPAASADQARSADAALNASYRKALAAAAAKDNFSTVKADDIRKAQRTWLAYRDAYLRFALAVPGSGKDAVLARLTRLRTAQLDQLGSN